MDDEMLDACGDSGMLDADEHALMSALGDVWQRFEHVAGDGPTREDDLREVAFHIHALQNTVLAQAAARAYPGEYRLLGCEGAWRTRAEPAAESHATRQDESGVPLDHLR